VAATFSAVPARDARIARVDAISEPAARASPREWLGLAVIALPCLLYSMDLTVLHLAVPELTADLQPGASQLLWITDVYGFMLAGCLITMGTLGDRIGRRRLLLTGAAAFGVASILAAFSTSAAMLIATRAMLGVAGATLAPSTLSLIRNMFLDPVERTTAIGVWAASFSLGAGVGPLAGGVLLERFWWGSVFLLGVPVMMLLLAVGPRLLPEFRDPAPRPLDIASAALSLVAVLAVIYGLKRIAEDGIAWPPLAAIAAGVALGGAFILRQRRLDHPLIELGLLRMRAVGAALVSNLLAIFVSFGSFLYVAQYLQLVAGLSPFAAGLWTLPSSGGFVAGSLLAPRLVRRVRPGFVMAGGLIVAACGLGLLAAFAARGGADPSLGGVVAASVLVALGISPGVTLASDLIVSNAPPERAGAAAAMSETCIELGAALGIAVLGSAGAAVYQRTLSDAALAALPPSAVAAARGTLGGALAIAEQTGGEAGAAVAAAARDAFGAAVAVSSALAAALAIGAAALAGILLRRVRSAGHAATP
jgi:DHA2 family multidrug resistance protein-like MFS transporter